MQVKNSYHPYAIITILFWSLAYVLTRLTLQYFSVFSLGFPRYVAASLALISNFGDRLIEKRKTAVKSIT